MHIRQEAQFALDRSTNLVTFKGLQEKTTGAYPIDATVTCTLQTAAGAPIAGAVDIQMPFVAGTSGVNSLYRGVIDSAVDLTGLANARIMISRAGAQREINVPCVAKSG